MLNKKIIIILLTISVFIFGVEQKQPILVSLIDVIANSEKYDKKSIVIVGFVSLTFENKALYISKDGFENAITKNALWIDIPIDEQNKNLNGKYVLIEGVYSSEKKGHLKLYSGTIYNISRIDKWHKCPSIGSSIDSIGVSYHLKKP